MNLSNLFRLWFCSIALSPGLALCAAAVGAEPQAQQEAHPLDPVIQWAEDALKRTEQIKDYTARLVKRERIGDELQDYQYMDIKIRHQPFSVYIKFLKPTRLSGREIIYVEGRNDGMLLAHDSRGLGEMLGTVALAPDGLVAMYGQRYPITMIGIKNLGERLIEQAKRDRQIGAPCDVKWFNDVKVDGRTARMVQVTHPVRHPDQQFAIAKVYIDKELGIPIRYEGYDWPETPGGDPVLVEEYTYTCLRPNVGLTDKDFDPKNPRYGFP